MEVPFKKEREMNVYRQGRQGITPESTSTLYTFKGSQATTSISHGGPPRPGSRSDRGGPFLTVRKEYSDNAVHLEASAGSQKDGVRFYSGPQFALTANGAASDYPVVIPSTSDELDAKGTTAIANVIPTNPSGSLVTTLGELRSEGVPKLLGAQAMQQRQIQFRRSAGFSDKLAKQAKAAPHSASSEYLNYVFGVRPLLQELQAFGKSVKDSERILRQYRKSADQKIKRTFTFPSETSTETIVAATARYPAPVLDTYLYGPAADMYQRGPLFKTTKIEKIMWFEGCFRYHLPVGNDLLSKYTRFSREADRLFGIMPTPEVVYNLTPWSWAFDWAGNMGDVMTNVSAAMVDGLVMQYGYIMETKRTTVTYVLIPKGGSYSTASGSTGTTGRKTGTPAMSLRQSWSTTTKTRRKATPYGFGLDWDGFSASQLAVIAALGITRTAPKYA